MEKKILMKCLIIVECVVLKVKYHIMNYLKKKKSYKFKLEELLMKEKN